MLQKYCLIVLCLISFIAHAEESTPALRQATEKYLNFIYNISTGASFPIMETAAEIISPECKKILNGQLFTQNREDFVIDLISVYENQGAWKVSPADVIIDSSSNTVVLRLFIEMERSGTYTAIVILRYNSNYLITEINEVFNQVKGSYDFKDNK